MITQADIIETLKTIRDPETDLNIVELLLVDQITIPEDGKHVTIAMGFQRKNPSCKACVPLAWYIQSKLIRKIEERVGALPGVETVEVLSQ